MAHAKIPKEFISPGQVGPSGPDSPGPDIFRISARVEGLADTWPLRPLFDGGPMVAKGIGVTIELGSG